MILTVKADGVKRASDQEPDAIDEKTFLVVLFDAPMAALALTAERQQVLDHVSLREFTFIGPSR
jgi:hypothetical protein